MQLELFTSSCAFCVGQHTLAHMKEVYRHSENGKRGGEDTEEPQTQCVLRQAERGASET